MQDSVKPYRKHAIFCVGGDPSHWESHVENQYSFISELEILLQEFNLSEENAVKLTVCNLPTLAEGSIDVIVYPNNRIYQLSPEIMRNFSLLLSGDDSIEIPSREVPWEKFILVCAHNSRDSRCGRAGLPLIAELQKQVQDAGLSIETDIKIAASSHIGGHKFAGTLISYPSNDWYGQVTARGTSIANVLEAIKTNSVFEKCYRGCGKSLSW